MSEQPADRPDEEQTEEYGLMARLEQLESLKEDMEDLGVSSLAEVEKQIEELNRLLDQMEADR